MPNLCLISDMPIQIGEKPSPTFAQPLALMSDCHRRVEKFLQALVIATEQAQGGPLNDLQREGLQSALRYFREAAPRHTADEEESLFPRMRQCSSEEVALALAKIDALEADHVVAKAAHAIVERHGDLWLEQGTLGKEETAELLRELRKLQGIYGRHIAVEDNDIFPLAQRVLKSNELAEVGREMAERRGQQFRAG
jgi:hemerythrin-like domain-containing protein